MGKLSRAADEADSRAATVLASARERRHEFYRRGMADLTAGAARPRWTLNELRAKAARAEYKSADFRSTLGSSSYSVDEVGAVLARWVLESLVATPQAPAPEWELVDACVADMIRVDGTSQEHRWTFIWVHRETGVAVMFYGIALLGTTTDLSHPGTVFVRLASPEEAHIGNNRYVDIVSTFTTAEQLPGLESGRARRGTAGHSPTAPGL